MSAHEQASAATPHKIYQHILVPLDGSEEVERVLPTVERVAAEHNASVTLLRATKSAHGTKSTLGSSPAPGIQPALGAVPPEDPAREMPPQLVEERREVERYLSSVAERLRSRGLTVAYEQWSGDPDEVIVERARALAVDVIILARPEHGLIGSLFTDNTARKVQENAPCEVMPVDVSKE